MKFFLPSSSFDGAKEGFVFKNGDFGIGYYKDHAGIPPVSSIQVCDT
jgi:hypothetical protein